MVRKLHATLTQTIREYKIKIRLQIAIHRTCNFNMYLQDPVFLTTAYKVPQNCCWKGEGSQQKKHYRFFSAVFLLVSKAPKLQNH